MPAPKVTFIFLSFWCFVILLVVCFKKKKEKKVASSDITFASVISSVEYLYLYIYFLFVKTTSVCIHYTLILGT